MNLLKRENITTQKKAKETLHYEIPFKRTVTQKINYVFIVR